jgi:hypothetical protein
VQVGAPFALALTVPLGAPCKHILEQIAEGGAAMRIRRSGEIKAGEAKRRAVVGLTMLAGIVAPPPIRIGEGLVGVENLSKTRRGFAIARVDIRMKSARKSPIRPLDVCGRRFPLYA